MFLLIIYFLVSILFSFLCSIWESVLLSITPSQVQVRFQQGTATGKLLKHFKDNIDQPLSAILTLNTIAHTVGAIGVGVQASKLWGNTPIDIFGMSITAEALVAAAMTLAILILSEIIPKTLGASYWKSLIPFTVQGINIIIYALYPLVWLSQYLTQVLKSDKDKSVLSRTDIAAMADIGARKGVFKSSESNIIKNLVRFNTLRANHIMTPRTVVFTADKNKEIQKFYDENSDLVFSRIPIFDNNKDHVESYVLKDELLEAIIDGEGQKKLASLARPITVVEEETPILELFDRLMEDREHVALVVDDYGGIAGLVTMEDIIETLLGMEIIDEMDNIEDMQALARSNWEKRARKLGLIQNENLTNSPEEN